jgi:hypothetical protein
MRNDKFKDITPQGVGNVGDLAYGRKFGNASKASRGDYPADWNEDTLQAKNPPVISIILVERDELAFKNVKRFKSKKDKNKVKNTVEFQNDFLRAFNEAHYKNRLNFNLTKLYQGKKVFEPII